MIQIGKIYKLKEREIGKFTNREYLHYTVPLIMKDGIVTYISLYNGMDGSMFDNSLELRYRVVELI